MQGTIQVGINSKELRIDLTLEIRNHKQITIVVIKARDLRMRAHNFRRW
jgi:hypothetical protein